MFEGATAGPISFDTLHWDGDQLLFTTPATGGADAVLLGTDAEYLPGNASGITVFQRDVNGSLLACHNSSGSSSVGDNSFYFSPTCSTAPFAKGATGSVGQGYYLWMPRTDGVTDGFNTFQGVRSTSPESATWTTPDAYRGSIDDPMSQHAYMWNGNNPYQYEDPSGYFQCDHCSTKELDALTAAAAALDKKVVDAMKRYSTSSSEYKALSALHQDLQPGKGNWHISFGRLKGDTAGVTFSHSIGIRGEAGYRITSAGPTILDLSKLDSRDLWNAALAQEGGIYEIGNGRVNENALLSLSRAQMFDNESTDIHQDRVVNAWFNGPIGVPDDP